MFKFSSNLILRFALVASILCSTEYASSKQWHKEYNDSCCGINLKPAMDYLQGRKMKPRREVVVGVIDSGLDSTAVDVKGALWTNPKEKQDGKDNDHNGYADDIHGWNFSFTANDIFGTWRYKIITATNNVESYDLRKGVSQYVSLSVNYQFNSAKSKYKGTPVRSDELNRL